MTNQWLVQIRETAGENAGENNDVHSLGRRHEEAGFHPAGHGSRGSLTAAGTAQGRSRAGARAELILLLGCLEMIQAILAAPRGDIGYLNLTGGEESLLYFYTFISLHFQQAGTVHLQNHLGKQKDNFH